MFLVAAGSGRVDLWLKGLLLRQEVLSLVRLFIVVELCLHAEIASVLVQHEVLETQGFALLLGDRFVFGLHPVKMHVLQGGQIHFQRVKSKAGLGFFPELVDEGRVLIFETYEAQSGQGVAEKR